MFVKPKSVVLKMFALICTVLCLSIAPACHALDIESGPVVQTPRFTQDHVYFYTASGPVDVTNTLYESQGNTYAIFNGAPVLIVLDYTAGTVRDANGTLIGFTAKPAS